MNVFRAAFLQWFPLAVAVTGLCLLIYVTVQQNYRQSLNDPQVQIAEAIGRELDTLDDSSNASLLAIEKRIGSEHVDIARDLVPWSGIYLYSAGDESAGTTATSGILNDGPAILPSSVFETQTWSKKWRLENGRLETRFTWQPELGVRQALVVVQFKTPSGIEGFAVAGRNMREVENRIDGLTQMIGLGWLVILMAIFFAQFISLWIPQRT